VKLKRTELFLMNKLSRRLEPFRALMYDPQRCGGLATVVCPPYDLIDTQLQQRLYQRSPFNIIRLELGRACDRYREASQTLRQWLEQGILRKTPKPAFYLYTQRFELDGRHLVRNGLIARIRLDYPGDAPILPHEKTFAGPKQDRLRLLEETRVNLSSIFGIFRGRSVELDEVVAKLSAKPPALAVTDDSGIENEIRLVEQADDIAAIQRSLEDRLILIADGHHRFETARAYRKQRRASENDPQALMPYDYTMITLTSSDDPGLVVKSFHRVVRRLVGSTDNDFAQRAEQWFELEHVTEDAQLEKRLAELEPGTIGAVLRARPGLYLMRLKSAVDLNELMADVPRPTRTLGVTILHQLILKRVLGFSDSELATEGTIEYTPDTTVALQAVRKAGAAAAFFLPTVTIGDIEKVSEAGATMPEKSTYFFPKLVTGLVMNPLDE